LQPALESRGGLSKVRCLAARKDPSVEIDVRLSAGDESESWRYAIGITQGARGRRQPQIRYEKVWRGEELVLNRPDEQDSADELRRTQTHLEQISANSRFREIGS